MNPVEIKLKAKYRSAFRGRYRSNHNMQTKTTRVKIGYEKHIARYGVPRQRVMHLLANGKVRMVNA